MTNTLRNMICGFMLLFIIPSYALPREIDNDVSGQYETFSFIVTADMRRFAEPKYQSSKYFMGVCEAIKSIGKGAFMISPGDIDPPEHVYNTIIKVLGEDYVWYPGLGNHETETPEDMEWLRAYCKKLKDLKRRGPENGEETTYSFDVGNAHFIVINPYYDGKIDFSNDANIVKPLYDWIESDLKANSKPFIFVIGHEPFISVPDKDNGRHRHKGDNLDRYPLNSHKFQQLLLKHSVTAYICGHTHTFSYAKINGLWQIDAGHCRGIGDKYSPSTFLKIWVDNSGSRVDVYRDDSNGGPYTLTETIKLN